MKEKSIIFLFLILFCYKNAQAQNEEGIKAFPRAIIVSSNHQIVNDTIYEGESYSGGAPLDINFISNVKTDKSNLVYEWIYSNDINGNSIILQRRDENTDFPIENSGTYYVSLIITDTNNGIDYYSAPFTISITESLFELPNAFSPNGDGINDIYYIKKLQSIIKFNAYIFNRWGQEMFRWDINNIDEGWDGKYHGKTVRDGVYFISAEAEGADGAKYTKKMAINVLTGTKNNLNGTTTE